ncbi:MAG: hypothetical protein AB1393_02975 [Candidatus Edwardsbacteria bacterium]
MGLNFPTSLKRWIKSHSTILNSLFGGLQLVIALLMLYFPPGVTRLILLWVFILLAFFFLTYWLFRTRNLFTVSLFILAIILTAFILVEVTEKELKKMIYEISREQVDSYLNLVNKIRRDIENPGATTCEDDTITNGISVRTFRLLSQENNPIARIHCKSHGSQWVILLIEYFNEQGEVFTEDKFICELGKWFLRREIYFDNSNKRYIVIVELDNKMFLDMQSQKITGGNYPETSQLFYGGTFKEYSWRASQLMPSPPIPPIPILPYSP